MEGKYILETAVKIATLMLESGAEIYRAEESISRICKAYGALSAEVFAIPSSIIATIYTVNEDPFTISRRVCFKDTDLDKVDQLNNLSRYICSNTPDYNSVQELIHIIMTRKTYSELYIVITHAIVPAVFCLFFGGTVIEALYSMIAGVIIRYMLKYLQHMKANILFTNIICGAIGALLSVVIYNAGLVNRFDTMIIGTIMLLVPGLVLTTAMRDFMLGDVVAGMLRLIEALLIAIGIAIGVAIILTLFGLF